MKILHVNNQIRLGGAETVIRQLLHGFPNSTLAVAEGKIYPQNVLPLYPRFLSRITHSRFHQQIEWIAPRARWTDCAFRRISDSSFDLVHLHNFHGQYASIESLAHLCKYKPVIWTLHALWAVTGGCDHPRSCLRYLHSCGDCPQLGRWPLGDIDNTQDQLSRKVHHLGQLPLHIVAPSKWLAHIVKQSPVGRRWHVHHIPNAVDSQFVCSLPPRVTHPLTILIVNRNFADEQKGWPIARDALNQIAPTARLLLVGQNSDHAAAEVPGWACESLGYLSDPAVLANAHSHSDIFLFASPAENFPCVVLEAMAAGLCVVATPTGGVVEQIIDGVSGLLAKDISAPSLAKVLSVALIRPDLRARLGSYAQSVDFSERSFIVRHTQLYLELLNSPIRKND